MGFELSPPMADWRSIEAPEFRQAMRNLVSAVAIVAAGAGAARRGLTVSSVVSVCIEPPCLLVGINVSSDTHSTIIASGSFGVSLLGNHQQDLARRFAGRDGVKGVDRSETAAWEEGLVGAPLLQTAICAMECVLHQHHMVGTHGIFVGRIVATRRGEGEPLVNFQGELRTLPQC
jgi:flavin reductase (DIM6/NTAB) family NADH-FMN oxidoreductase RutF